MINNSSITISRHNLNVTTRAQLSQDHSQSTQDQQYHKNKDFPCFRLEIIVYLENGHCGY